MSFQRRTWEILEVARPGDRASRTFDIVFLTLIALNVLAVILGTVRSFEARWTTELLWLERVSVLLFSIEYVLRVWCAPLNPRVAGARFPRLRYVVTPMAVIDLLAILPFFLPFVSVDLRFARALRLMRLFRIAKLGRYMTALRLFGTVLRAKREELVLTTLVLLLVLLMAASLMYFAENAAQPERFSSIPAAMWWAVATLTTVGYGDVYPVTGWGRLLGACVAILGIGLFALPTAIFGTGFIEEINRRKTPQLCPHCGLPTHDAA